ncbi:MAG: SDR family oxidoreductase, partial [Acidimicrobiales bacterium]
MTVTVITGANSGIGRATALHLAGAGHRVFGTMRSLSKGDKLEALAADMGVEITPIVLDVTDDAQVTAGFDKILDTAGTVDVLVNNAGIASNASLEDVDVTRDKAVFYANVWGTVRCAQAVLPAMRAQGSGHIVQISSIAGRVGLAGQAIYSASKWALEGMSESMAHDLARFGIRVSLVEPGVTRTAILPKNPDAPPNPAYADTYARMFDMYASGIVANVRAEVVAQTIQDCIDAPPGQMRWPVAWGGGEMAGARIRGEITGSQWVELGTL